MNGSTSGMIKNPILAYYGETVPYFPKKRPKIRQKSVFSKKTHLICVANQRNY